MAQFKLFLLTPSSSGDINSVEFLKTTISEFYSNNTQIEDVDFSSISTLTSNKTSYCYSFNEKFSIHTNGQKELNFSMLRKVWLGDEWITNPFVEQMHNGVQLLLEDKYNNQMIFTIKNISYKLGSSNITYDISCQDSFSYQTIRLNDGYTIDNANDSEEFIGAKSIDWWVVNKIQPECYLRYQYIPLFQGLCLTKNGSSLKLQTFFEDNNLSNVVKIIKPVYDSSKYQEYYETIPFSVSGSNCSAALIALGEELGLMLNYAERVEDDGTFTTYFWFEPKRREEVSNIQYSPYTSVQSFGFTQAGDSLTTVMNVESNTIADEIISLIPNVPLFFNKVFSSSDWKTGKFKKGFFTDLCKSSVFIGQDGKSAEEFNYTVQDLTVRQDTETERYYIDIPVYNTETHELLIPPYYSRISLNTDELESYLYISSNTNRYTTKTATWEFVVGEEPITDVNGIKPTEEGWIPTYAKETIYNDTFSLIPQELFATSVKAFIRVWLMSETDNKSINLSTSQIILNFYREPDEDELEFAQIADECPWLENKLINFQYFLDQNIISREEYQELFNIISNDLRITNGQLLYHSASYYTALHEKTKLLANLINDLDALGAAFEADVISSFTNNGVVDNTQYLSNAYTHILTTYLQKAEPEEVLGYENVLTDYLNKYFNSQQRFLKNIYNFTSFFNELYGTNETVYKHVLKITRLSEDHGYYLNFTNTQFQTLNKDFSLFNTTTYKPWVDIFDKDKNKIDVVYLKFEDDKAVPVWSDDKTSGVVYEPSINAGDMVAASDFNNRKSYYRIAYWTEVIRDEEGNVTSTHEENISWALDEDTTICFYKHHIENNKAYYCFAAPDSTVIAKFWTKESGFQYDEVEIEGLKYTRELIVVPLNEIISEFLYNKATTAGYAETLSDTDPFTKWYYHSSDTSESVKDLYSYNTLTGKIDNDDSNYSWIKQFTPWVWSGLTDANNMSDESWDLLQVENKDNNITEERYKWDGVKESTLKKIPQLFAEKFPITTITFTGSKFRKEPFQCGEYSYDYQQVNKTNQTVNQYINYWKALKNEEAPEEEVENPTTYTESTSLSLVTPSNESLYYRRVVEHPGWVTAGIIANFMFTPLGLGALSADHMWKQANTKWDVIGINTKDWDNKWIGKNEGYVFYNSDRLNYATSEESYQQYQDLNANFSKYFIHILTEIDPKAEQEEDPSSPVNNDGAVNGYVVASVGDYKLYNKVNTTNNKKRKELFNYFNLVGLRYFDAVNCQDDRLTYKESYLRPLKLGDKINLDYSYSILILSKSTNSNTSLVFTDGNYASLSSLLKEADTGGYNVMFRNKNFFIANCLSQVDFSNFKGVKTEDNTLQEFLGASGYSTSDTDYEYVINIVNNDGSGDSMTVVIFQNENFKRESIVLREDFSGNYLKYNKRFSLYDGRSVYDDYNMIEIDFLEEKDLAAGFFTPASSDSAWEAIESIDLDENGSLPDIHFYKKVADGSYERIYSIAQLQNQDAGICYYPTHQTKTIENLSELHSDLELTLYAHHEKEDGSRDSVLLDSMVKLTSEDSNNNTYEISAEDKEGNVYHAVCTVTTTAEHNIGKLTNGNFWYLYRSRGDMPVLQKRAALIESQLTQYWSAAYGASKQCEYFLPESWQPRINGSTNYFASAVLKETSSGITISPMFVPKVKKYFDGRTSRLPRYSITYGKPPQVEEDNILKRINKKETTTASSIQFNRALTQAFEELGETFNNITFEGYNTSAGDITKTTYYYAESGGTKWYELTSKIAPSAGNYDYMNGLYIMTYKLLKKCFANKTIEEYQNTKKKHDDIWKKIHRKYPGIILENVYKNDAATTSLDLYKLSKNAFKDLSYPEKGYNISLIDIDNLKGYQGQELRIGDGILVDASEYYEENDIVKKGISQYLFITDISYDLRKDNDISLTVNSIKYQDKLIQRLAKLIK